jgi:hypothetical protein
MENYSEGLATGMALSQDRYPGYCNYGNNGGFGFGGEWGGLIGLLIVASLFGGNGWGFGNNRGNCGGSCATQADLAAGFNNSAVLSSLNDIKLGQASMQNFINQGFSGLNTAILQGFHGVDNAVCTLGYQQAQGFNSLGHQISDCCCTTQRAIDSVKYENAKNTCDIIRAGQDNTRQILDFLCNEKISSLQAENAGLRAQISNDRQSAYIIGALTPKCPEPAYIVPNPNCCYNYNISGVGYGNNGCCFGQ